MIRPYKVREKEPRGCLWVATLCCWLSVLVGASASVEQHLKKVDEAIAGYRVEISILEKKLHTPAEGVGVVALARVVDDKQLLEAKMRAARKEKAALERQLFSRDYAAYQKVLASPDVSEAVRVASWIDLCKAWGVTPLREEKHLIWSALDARVIPVQEMGAGTAGTCRVIGLGGGVELGVVWCPPGTFLMGGASGEENEQPAHEVELSRGFWMGVSEVTREQFMHVMGEEKDDRDLHLPITSVTWHDANMFCERVSLSARLWCALPTEAQWEYACRAGEGEAVPQPLGEYAWYDGNSHDAVQEVATLNPNAWGLYDMLGNVREWCADGYDDMFYWASPKRDPLGPNEAARVVRGGCWFYDGSYCRPTRRGSSVPDAKNDSLGFRVLFY